MCGGFQVSKSPWQKQFLMLCVCPYSLRMKLITRIDPERRIFFLLFLVLLKIYHSLYLFFSIQSHFPQAHFVFNCWCPLFSRTSIFHYTSLSHIPSYFSLHHLPAPPALKDDRFQMVLFTPRLVRITLTNVSVSDEGGYFCQLYTDATHHQVATLSVSVPPDTPTVEEKQEAVEGGEVELTCVSPRSKPAATLRWIRNGREITGTWTRFIEGLVDGERIMGGEWGN